MPALSPKGGKVRSRLQATSEAFHTTPCKSCSLAPLSDLLFFIVLIIIDRLVYFSLLAAVLSFVSCCISVPRRVPVTLQKHLPTEQLVLGDSASHSGQDGKSRVLRTARG